MSLRDQIKAAVKAAKKQPPKVVLEPLLAAADTDAIVRALPEVGDHDWILRTHLAERLGRDSSVYQHACFFMIAQAVKRRERVAGAIESVVGSGRLNDDVLVHHLGSPDPHYRVAAVHGLAPRHLALLEERLAVETDKRARDVMSERGRLMALAPGAPVSTLVTPAERLTAMLRRLVERTEWVAIGALGDALGADREAIEAVVARLSDPSAGDSDAEGLVSGPRGVRWSARHEVWSEADQLAAAGDAAGLRAHVDGMRPGKVPPGFEPPPLEWADGVALSETARRVRLADPSGGATAAAIDRLMAPASLRALIAWWLEDKARQKKVPLAASDPAVATLIELEGAKGVLGRKSLGDTWGDAGAALLYLQMQGAQGDLRNDLRITLERRGGLLNGLTDEPPPLVERSVWRRHLRREVETWLRCQTPLWLPQLRLWWRQPLLREVCEGVVFESDGQPVVFRDRDGGLLEGPVLDANALLRVLHPVSAATRSAAFAWPDDTPRWQRDRPHHTLADLPPLGADSPTITFADWRRRTQELGYLGDRASLGGVCETSHPGLGRIHHSGHGAGYGGNTPQRLTAVSPLHSRDPAILSELVWDVRRIAGVDPLSLPE